MEPIVTVQELSHYGNDRPVLYRGQRAIFECLSMNFAPWSPRRQPMKAAVRLSTGRRIYVSPKQLAPMVTP
jgi:hypothetical protein